MSHSIGTKPHHQLADETTSFLDSLVEALKRAGAYNKNDQTPPAVVLWPDKERQWEALLPALRERLPLMTFGPYAAAQKTGPAYWLRAMLANTLDDKFTPTEIPIIYLPGISKSELRAVEECPKPLQPLAELQFRGVLWTHKNGRDWTVAGFLQSSDGGLGIDVASDVATKQALLRALPKIASLSTTALRKEAPLRITFFDSLLNPDDVRNLLVWLNDPVDFRRQTTPEAWEAFSGLCLRKYGLHPETDGPMTLAEALGNRRGAWQAVWERFADAPHLYPNIPTLLRQARPKQMALFEPAPTWPQDNEGAETRLRDGLLALQDQLPDGVRTAVAQLEKEHAPRRGWVWAALGKAPLAIALHHLTMLMTETEQAVGGASTTIIAVAYTERGWRADVAVLDALASVERQEDVVAVKTAINVLYRPWLENAARALQAMVIAGDYASKSLPSPEAGTCILFCDALRMDLGQRLAEAFVKLGLTCTVQAHLAALPTVTPTAKIAVSPVASHFTGAGMPKLEPALQANGSRATADLLRRTLTEAGVQVLKDDELGDPTGRAWTELGALDTYGHQHGWKIAQHARGELRALEARVEALLNVGWKQVVVVTDHGWLMLPGGLPKAELPEHLTVIRKGRCARLKEGASSDQPVVAWHWDRNVQIAIALGVSCYEAGKEYEHGGISPQECVVPVLVVARPAGGDSRIVVIESIQWKRLRCVIKLAGVAPRMSVDVRKKAGDPSTSLITTLKSPSNDDTVSLVVENEDLVGEAAIVVVLTETGQVCAQTSTIIGG